VVEFLPCKPEVLSSNPSTINKKLDVIDEKGHGQIFRTSDYKWVLKGRKLVGTGRVYDMEW
jgi:hypothetical protein